MLKPRRLKHIPFNHMKSSMRNINEILEADSKKQRLDQARNIAIETLWLTGRYLPRIFLLVSRAHRKAFYRQRYICIWKTAKRFDKSHILSKNGGGGLHPIRWISSLEGRNNHFTAADPVVLEKMKALQIQHSKRRDRSIRSLWGQRQEFGRSLYWDRR